MEWPVAPPVKVPTVMPRRPHATRRARVFDRHERALADVVDVLNGEDSEGSLRDRLMDVQKARLEIQRRDALVRLAAWALRRAVYYEQRIAERKDATERTIAA